jgi:hypothetical protein
MRLLFHEVAPALSEMKSVIVWYQSQGFDTEPRWAS